MASDIELSSVEDNTVEELDSIPGREAAPRAGGILYAADESDGTVVPFLVRKSGRIYRVAPGTKFLVRERADAGVKAFAAPAITLEPADEEEILSCPGVQDLDGSPYYVDQVIMAEKQAARQQGDTDRELDIEELVGDWLRLASPEESAPDELARPEPVTSKSCAPAECGPPEQNAAPVAPKPEATQNSFDASLRQAEAKAGAFLRAVEAYKRDGHEIREDLTQSIFETKSALESLVASLFFEAQKQIAMFTEDLAALHHRQADTAKMLQDELLAVKGAVTSADAPAAKPTVPIGEVEVRRAALIKEIKQLVEYRGQLKTQLEALLAQLATHNSPKRVEQAQPTYSDQWVEEICSPKREVSD